MGACRDVGYGPSTPPVNLIECAQNKRLASNVPGRRTVEGTPHSATCASMRRWCTPLMDTRSRSWSPAAAREERTTTCSTPASAAAATKGATPPSAGNRKSCRTPSKQPEGTSAAVRSPSTTSTRESSPASAGFLVSARTSSPASSRPDTTRRPMEPVAPVTRTDMGTPFPGLVEPAPCEPTQEMTTYCRTEPYGDDNKLSIG